MSLFIDQKFINLIAPHLRNFKRSGAHYNFSCPVCGDSKKDTSATRGWFYQSNGETSFKCYNCNAPFSFHAIIKLIDSNLSKQYYIDKLLGERGGKQELPVLAPKQVIELSEFDIPRITTLPDSHKAIQYLKDRKIDKKFWSDIYYAEKFKTWCNSKKYTFQEEYLHYDHARIIFPYRNVDGRVFGFAARTMGQEIPKYLTIKLDENEEKVFGINRLDFSKRLYAVEGQIDSFFIDNCFAVSGSGFITNFTKKHIDNCTMVFDNEPRNKPIMDLLLKTIKAGFDVCIWPNNIRHKDINEMILAGMSKEKIKTTIDSNTYSGAVALLKYNEWIKVK